MAAVATFTYNGTDTITAHITGATPGNTITVYPQDDDFATNVSVVAPSASFNIPVGPVGVSNPVDDQRSVFAWDEDDGNAIIGVTMFSIGSGITSQVPNPVVWDFDGVDTVTATWNTANGILYALETFIGDFDEYEDVTNTSSGGSFTLQTTAAVHTKPFVAEVLTSVGDFDYHGCRIFTPGVAGQGQPGNPIAIPESCVFTYDGGSDLSVTITDAEVGVTYRMASSDFDSTPQNVVAATSTVVINITDVGGDPDGYRFRGRVSRLDNNSYVGCTGFTEGTPGEAGAGAAWTTDGVEPPTVTVTFDSELGVNYRLRILSNQATQISSAVGTGASLLMTTPAIADMVDGYMAQLSNDDSDEDLINRLFVMGAAGAGEPGNPPQTAVALSPTNVSATSANFRGIVNPAGVECDAYFVYGNAINNYSAQTGLIDVGAGTSDVPVEKVISGLLPDHTYHYRLAIIESSQTGGSGTGAGGSGNTGGSPGLTGFKPAYHSKITKGYYASQDGPDANYQVIWLGQRNGTYSIDRTVSDTVAFAVMFEIDPAWNPATQGNWGRMFNFHNTSLETNCAGWCTGPGNSAVAVDYVGGDLILNVDDNAVKNYTIESGLTQGVMHTLAFKMVLGRTSGTPNTGSVRIALDGIDALNLTNINTLWNFPGNIIQRYMWFWAGFYSQNVQSVLEHDMCYPWIGTTPAAALANTVGGEDGAWAVSNIPIAGRDHSDGPAICTSLGTYDAADLVLPGWFS